MSCHFDYLGTSFCLDSDSPQDPEWLLQFLGRSRSLKASQRLTCRVELRRAPERLSTGHSRDSAPGQLEVFKLDSRFQELKTLSKKPLRALEPEQDWILEFLEPEQIRLLYSSHTPLLERRLALLRLIRELATSRSEARGNFTLHASALVYNDVAVAFVGPKRAGKSTTLLHCLRSPRTQYLANDRLQLDPKSLATEEIPTVVSLRPGTLNRIPNLRDTLSKLERTWYGVSAPPQVPDEEARYLSPAQLCQAVKKRALQKASLKAMVFPDIQPRRTKTACSEFIPTPEELRSALFSPGLKRKAPIPTFPEASQDLSQQLEILRNCGLRFYRWELGPDSLKEIQEVEKRLERDLADRP